MSHRKIICPICKINKIEPRANSCRDCCKTWIKQKSKTVSRYEKYRNEKWLTQKYINEEKSMTEISKIVGCCLQTISDWLDEFKIKKRSFGNINSIGPRGKKHAQWNGGKCLRGDGYVLIFIPERAGMGNPYMLEHRLVMEKYLGRKLKRSEIVHHKDGNRQNNKIENLELKNLKIHSAMGYKQGYNEGFTMGQIRGFLNGILFLSLGILKK